MSHVIVRHVKSLPIPPGPHTCVHVAHTMRSLKKKGREGGMAGGREGWREGGKGGRRKEGREEGRKGGQAERKEGRGYAQR